VTDRPAGPLRVVVADDHYLVREGVRQALESAADIQVVAVVGSAPELETVVDAERPDAVVTDIRMPPLSRTDGIDAARRIRRTHPGTGILVLSQYNDPSYARQLLEDGADGVGYLLKERVGDPGRLVAAVHEVTSGGSVVDPEVVASLVARTERDPNSPTSLLTDREREVLAAMAEGRTNSSIAESLHLSVSSIEKYSSSIFAKLGLLDEPELHRRVAAVLAFLDDRGRAQPL
jgi:DNA-binding NarL/FixJ family response regulator